MLLLHAAMGSSTALLRLGAASGARLAGGAARSARPRRLAGSAGRAAALLERLVADVAELLDHLGLDSAHIVGNSAGGYLGQQLAMTMPERVRACRCSARRRASSRARRRAGSRESEAKGLRGFLAETIRDRLPQDADPGLVEWFLDEAAKNDPAYIGKFVLLMASYDWSGEVQKIACPTLVVIPGAETVGTVANYDPFRRLADVEFRVYEGLPHNICDAVPDRCAADVRDFLRARFGSG